MPTIERNINTAQAQYYSRPQDERFPSFAAYLEHGAQKKRTSLERTYSAKDLQAVLNNPADADNRSGKDEGIALASPKGAASFTHWSFGQLARSISAPASYLRQLPATIAAQAVNYGLQHTPPATDLSLLLTLPDGADRPIVRASTSEKYGRAWDFDLHRPIIDTLTSGRDGGDWKLPTAWDGKPAGAYAGDRDSFLIAINGGSIVEDPSARQGNGAMFRGIMVRNSEVGASSIVIVSVFFRFICGNLMLWCAVLGESFRRRHVGQDAARDAIRTAYRLARTMSERAARQDEQIIAGLIRQEIATTKEGVIDELIALKFTKDEATEAYAAAERQEQNPRSRWGIVQGITQMSQESGYQDERFALDLKAAQILKKGAALVAA
jgi:hypothetical protein